MMHEKSDSDDATSLAPSSPHSPKRPVYYVQSPSHDGSKSSSMHTTLAFNSPVESSSSRYSRESSSTRFSGTVKWPAARKRAYCGVIDEEADYDHPFSDHYGYSLRCRILIALFFVSLLFTAFCFAIWGASKPFKAKISVQSLSIHNFYLGQGTDLTGVPTKLATTNCSVKMIVHNPATFFGIHVSSMHINLMYSQIILATGELEKYYQPRKSYRTVTVNLEGNKVPLYGAGGSIPALDSITGIPVRLVFGLWSQGNVVGKLVKSTHTRRISCPVVISEHNNKLIALKEGSCTV